MNIAGWLLVIFGMTTGGNLYAVTIPFDNETACVVARQVVLSELRDGQRDWLFNVQADCIPENKET